MRKITLMLIAIFALTACQQQAKVAEQTVETKRVAGKVVIKDYGAEPIVLNIDDYTTENKTFRTALWTGNFMQVTLMSIPVGGEVGLEVHYDIEQFLRIEAGVAEVQMGDKRDELTFIYQAAEDDAIFVPIGKWHNIVNKGDKPLKLYSIYAKPEHPHSTIHQDKAASDAVEHHH